MTNGQLFIKENPTIEVKINGSCVWIYFDGVNYHTIPVEWWDKEIDVLDKIRAEIEQIAIDYDKFANYKRAWGLWIALDIINKYEASIEPQERSDKE